MRSVAMSAGDGDFLGRELHDRAAAGLLSDPMANDNFKNEFP